MSEINIMKMDTSFSTVYGSIVMCNQFDIIAKNGYNQITYRWNDSTYKYEVRWHTKTPNALVGQGNTWVVERTLPGSGGSMPQSHILLSNGQWVSRYEWQAAIWAQQNGIATPIQVEILDKGHIKE